MNVLLSNYSFQKVIILSMLTLKLISSFIGFYRFIL